MRAQIIRTNTNNRKGGDQQRGEFQSFHKV